MHLYAKYGKKIGIFFFLNKDMKRIFIKKRKQCDNLKKKKYTKS